MAYVRATPEELERFAQSLTHFNQQLSESMSRLDGEFRRLSDTWLDQDHQRFAAEYEQTIRALGHFQRAAEEQIPFLRRKAQRLRDYQSQR